MRHAAAPPPTIRRAPRLVVIGLLGLVVAIVAMLALRATWPSTTWPSSEFGGGVRSGIDGQGPSSVDGRSTTTGDGVVSEYDGVVPDGVTPFDEQFAAVANLDPELLDAVRDAANDAADDGVVFHINSGWRSAEYQLRLLREAVAQYGSEAEAGRWVATPETSAHVSGDAVDIGPFAASAWLAEHGADYGLCQTYRNEPWHFELRPDAEDRGCPPMYSDPTEDPRMQQP